MEHGVEVNYLDVVSAYDNSTFNKVFGIESIKFYIAVISFLMLSVVGLLLVKSYFNYSLLGILFFGSMLIYYILKLRKDVNKKFKSQFNFLGVDEFLNRYKTYWTSYHYLLFCQNIYKLKKGKISQSVVDLISEEITGLDINILKQPFFVGGFAFVSILLHQAINGLSVNSSWLILLIITILVIMYYAFVFVDILKTKSQKLQELKIFGLWYNDFGYKLINDNAPKVTLENK